MFGLSLLDSEARKAAVSGDGYDSPEKAEDQLEQTTLEENKLMLKIIASRLKVGSPAVLIMAVSLFGGCARQEAQPAKAPSPQESPQKESAKQGESVPSSPAAAGPAQANGFRVEGAASIELDQIVGRIGARAEGRMLANTIDILSEGHARPQRSAKVDSTIGGFSAKGAAGSGKAACQIAAFSDAKIKVEANGDGSNAKITSPLTGIVAKVYGDLRLAGSSVVIPKGTVLRREENAWVAINDANVEKRLDGISGGGATKGAAVVGFTSK